MIEKTKRVLMEIVCEEGTDETVLVRALLILKPVRKVRVLKVVK